MKTNGFTIIEKMAGKGQESVYSKYNCPVLSIGNTNACFPVKIIEKLELKAGDEILFALNNDESYVAVVPITSNIKGYKLNTGGEKSKSNLYLNSVSIVKRGLKKGIYTIGDSVFINGIDWYKLILIK